MGKLDELKINSVESFKNVSEFYKVHKILAAFTAGLASVGLITYIMMKKASEKEISIWGAAYISLLLSFILRSVSTYFKYRKKSKNLNEKYTIGTFPDGEEVLVINPPKVYEEKVFK